MMRPRAGLLAPVVGLGAPSSPARGAASQRWGRPSHGSGSGSGSSCARWWLQLALVSLAATVVALVALTVRQPRAMDAVDAVDAVDARAGSGDALPPWSASSSSNANKDDPAAATTATATATGTTTTSSMGSSRLATTEAEAAAPTTSLARRCTPAEARIQGKFVEAAKVRGCPSADDAFMRLAHAVMPHARVFVDIGSNKGYTAARFYELWSPQVGLNAAALHASLLVVAPGSKELTECGACGDCHDSNGPLVSPVSRLCSREASQTTNPNVPQAQHTDGLCREMAASFQPIRVFSFDGNPDMVNGVRKAAADFVDKARGGASKLEGVANVPPERLPRVASDRLLDFWKLEHAAFMDEYTPGKTVTFSLGEGETGHMQNVGGRKEAARAKTQQPTRLAEVPVLTVDALLAREHLDHVDVLKIDVEGHDPLVLRGAKQTLRAGRATLVMFEYNVFAVEPLADTTRAMEGFGYVCYLEGKNALLKLTHGCWSSPLEMRRWSNVLCAYAGSAQGLALVAVFDAYSVAHAAALPGAAASSASSSSPP